MGKSVLLVVIVMVLCAQALPLHQFQYGTFGNGFPYGNIMHPQFIDPFSFIPSFSNYVSQSGGTVMSGGTSGLVSTFNSGFGTDHKSFLITNNNGKVDMFVNDNGKKRHETIELDP